MWKSLSIVVYTNLDSELLASPSLEGGSPLLSTSVTGVTHWEGGGDWVHGWEEKTSTTACSIPSQTMISHA